MAKIEITRTDLVRPGKYKEDEMLKEARRVNLSFELIESINMSVPRACRGAGALARSPEGSFGRNPCHLCISRSETCVPIPSLRSLRLWRVAFSDHAVSSLCVPCELCESYERSAVICEFRSGWGIDGTR